MSQTSEPTTIETFWEYREQFRSRMRRLYSLGAAEETGEYHGPPPMTALNEQLIQAIWANQLLRIEGLKLVDGRPVRVLEPGRWNGAAGPDFIGARLMIGARTVLGDVEIHLKSSQWREHRHGEDLDYNSVVLHAVFENDDGGPFDTLHNGDELPRLELEPYLFPDLETLQRSMTPDDFQYGRPASLGKCYELMTTLEGPVIADFLDRAGDERLTAKVRRLEDQLRHAGMEQMFYQALMMSLGAGPGKSLYYLLAKRTPAAELLDYAGELDEKDQRLGIEALLLDVAGLMPEAEALADAPEEARAHAADLDRIWKRFEPLWADRMMAATRRWYRGVRPVNFPTRRLAAMSILLHRSARARRPLLRELHQRIAAAAPSLKEAKATRRLHPLLRELIDFFQVDDPASFWSMHYSFTARPAARRMKLIGEATARSIVFNAVIPAMALLARREGDEELSRAAQSLYAIFPRLPSNHVTEFMAHRLFGDTPRAKDMINTERRQQGLFQIFYSCCNNEEKNCDQCYYLKQT